MHCTVTAPYVTKCKVAVQAMLELQGMQTTFVERKRMQVVSRNESPLPGAWAPTVREASARCEGSGPIALVGARKLRPARRTSLR